MDRRWHQNDYHIREITRVLDDVMPRAENLKEAYSNYYEDEEGKMLRDKSYAVSSGGKWIQSR
jgi:hypothetical protein